MEDAPRPSPYAWNARAERLHRLEDQLVRRRARREWRRKTTVGALILALALAVACPLAREVSVVAEGATSDAVP